MKNLKLVSLLVGGLAMAPMAAVPAAAQDSQSYNKQSSDSAQKSDRASKSDKMKKAQGNTIVDVAGDNEDFSTLVSAVKAAELVDTLEGEGPYTVFAPNNAAFDGLPEGSLDLLLKAENQDALKTVLTYHVVSGKVRAADLLKMIRENDGEATVTTVEGTELTARTRNGDVILTDEAGNEIRVTNTNINASNGVVHVIDGVLLPASGDA
jgi:uncharacterized surface protein with fasciclin (FAS1) repeats